MTIINLIITRSNESEHEKEYFMGVVDFTFGRINYTVINLLLRLPFFINLITAAIMI